MASVHVATPAGEPALEIAVLPDDTVAAFKARYLAAAGLTRYGATHALVVDGTLAGDETVPAGSAGLGGGGTPVRLGLRQVALPQAVRRRERVAADVRRAIRAKAAWFAAVEDDAAVAEWESEALAAFRAGPTCAEAAAVPFDAEEAWARVLQDLRDEARCVREGRARRTPADGGWFVRVGDADGDGDGEEEGLDGALCDALDESMAALRGAEDWQEGSDGQVLNVLDPSLGCAVRSEVPLKRRRRAEGDEAGNQPRVQYAWVPTSFVPAGPGAQEVKRVGPVHGLGSAHPQAEVAVGRAAERVAGVFRRVRLHKDEFDDGLSRYDKAGKDKEASGAMVELPEELQTAKLAFYKKKIDENMNSGYHFGLGRGESWFQLLTETDPGTDWKQHLKRALDCLASRRSFDTNRLHDAAVKLSLLKAEPLPKKAFAAAERGDLAALKQMGIRPGNVNVPGEDGRTLLYAACRGGRTKAHGAERAKVVRWLVQSQSADWTVRNTSGVAEGSLPLQGAAYSGNHAVVHRILYLACCTEQWDTAVGADGTGKTPVDCAKKPLKGVTEKEKTLCLSLLQRSDDTCCFCSTYADDEDVTDGEENVGAAVKMPKKELKAWRKQIHTEFVKIIPDGPDAVTKACALWHEVHKYGGNPTCCGSHQDLFALYEAWKESREQKLANEYGDVLQVPVAMQMVVRAVDIVLSPDKPVYAGRDWQREWQGDEAVSFAAAAVCCYKESNVTPYHIEFRDNGVEPWHAEPDTGTSDEAESWLTRRLESWESGEVPTRYLGEASVPVGRCVAYSNKLQTREAPFQLRDATKPGYRRLLVFYLYDPERPSWASAPSPLSRDAAVAQRALVQQFLAKLEKEDKKAYERVEEESDEED
eukprot:Rhum_TRINITY_DN15450_c0_g1::Rhum_TRINITY_DN15450_c0_g1_i16::g.157949::m.157949